MISNSLRGVSSPVSQPGLEILSEQGQLSIYASTFQARGFGFKVYMWITVRGVRIEVNVVRLWNLDLGLRVLRQGFGV